jgi:hypothetical protein
VTAPASARPNLLVPILVVVLGALVCCGSAGAAAWRGVSNSGSGKVAVDSGSLPAVCGLVPSDLMSRLAPGAPAEDKDDTYPTRLQVTKRCEARTGYTGETFAALRIEVSRYGTFLDYPPHEHAKRDFITDKRIASQLSMGPPRDVEGLGESAFITVDPKPIGDYQRAEVNVLRRDVLVVVNYEAKPSAVDDGPHRRRYGDGGPRGAGEAAMTFPRLGRAQVDAVDGLYGDLGFLWHLWLPEESKISVGVERGLGATGPSEVRT